MPRDPTLFLNSAGRLALIHRYWQRNEEEALRALLGPSPRAGKMFDLRVTRMQRGKLVDDRFLFTLETRRAPAGAPYSLELRVTCEGTVLEYGRFYPIEGSIH